MQIWFLRDKMGAATSGPSVWHSSGSYTAGGGKKERAGEKESGGAQRAGYHEWAS
jgi:hypothetical protein